MAPYSYYLNIGIWKSPLLFLQNCTLPSLIGEISQPKVGSGIISNWWLHIMVYPGLLVPPVFGHHYWITRLNRFIVWVINKISNNYYSPQSESHSVIKSCMKPLNYHLFYYIHFVALLHCVRVKLVNVIERAVESIYL